MTIPVSLLYDLERIPCDRPVGLLMRHSARFPITDEALNHLVGLTEEGVRMAEDFGALLARRFQLGRLHSSPVGRCIDTANAVARGAGWPVQSVIEGKLAHEFIASSWDQIRKGELNGHLPIEVRSLLEFVLGDPGKPRLDVLVTHDTVLATVITCFMGVPATGPDMPRYLEGLLIWRAADGIHTFWRSTEQVWEDLSYNRGSRTHALEV
jgi:phosphohistidine phosphatase SixA